MVEEVEFLFDNQLIAAVESLIRSAKNKLVLISPFIDLDARIIDALNEKKPFHNFELQVLFGKNEANYLKSIKRNSLEFFKDFPNVEIRYNERLHAKFFLNDYNYIITSLNLYDYSLANNIEVGVKVEYASKGILGKAFEVTGSLIEQGVDKVKQDVLGINKEVNPIEKFKMIFQSSDLLYKTEPFVVDKSGITGLLGSKKLEGYNVVVNNFQATPTAVPVVNNYTAPTTTAAIAPNPEVFNTKKPIETGKCVSASQLGKSFGLQAKDITSFMEKKGLIAGDKITDIGKAKGLVIKNYMGSSYIAYPEELNELNELR